MPTISRPRPSCRPILSPILSPVLALSLLASVGAAGCNPQDVEEFIGGVGDSTSSPSGRSVPFEEFSDDVGTRAATESRVLIRSAQGYFEYFGHAAPAGVDLGRQWVIFYAAGTRRTGGFDANVLSLTRDGKSLVAVTELVSPGANCAVTTALTSPSVLIKFAAQADATIQFSKKDRTQDCGDTTNPCAATLCLTGTHCEVQEVVCVRAPCPPQAVCVPNPTKVFCGGIAGIPCPGFGVCVDDPTDDCDPKAGGADCGGICTCDVVPAACIVGSVIDNSPSVCGCVPATPPPPPDPCAAVRCMAGTHCEATPGKCAVLPCPPGAACARPTPCPPAVACVPDAPPPVQCGGFGGFPCPGGGRCVDDPSDSCDPNAGGADCGGICTCIQTVACVQGATFDNSPAVCACVPTAPPPAVHCGGIAGIACPGGGRCADDPSDSCDPNAGGADCGGICTCIQTASCIIGATFDNSPKVCSCVPGKPVCGPVCDIFCEFGHVLDPAGCPTCACNPAPPPPK